jgi:2-methylisocitrate lyase-like PEP mutase family enzyme
VSTRPTIPFTEPRDQQQARARSFRELHEDGGCLVLPTIWDTASALLAEAAGATALGTTSAGVAWAHGRADGEGMTAARAVGAVRPITAAVRVPVTADIEGGYGGTPPDVAGTVRAVVDAGAVGINLEDSPGTDAPLRGIAEQCARLSTARAVADDILPELFINARTDLYLAGAGDPARRHELALERAAAYAEAGADLLFVPGLLDLAQLGRLVAEAPIGISAMAVPGGPTVAELRGTGVRRVSVGSAIAQAAYALVRTATAELLEQGTYLSLEGGVSYPELNGLMRS